MRPSRRREMRIECREIEIVNPVTETVIENLEIEINPETGNQKIENQEIGHDLEIGGEIGQDQEIRRRKIDLVIDLGTNIIRNTKGRDQKTDLGDLDQGIRVVVTNTAEIETTLAKNYVNTKKILTNTRNIAGDQGADHKTGFIIVFRSLCQDYKIVTNTVFDLTIK